MFHLFRKFGMPTDLYILQRMLGLWSIGLLNPIRMTPIMFSWQPLLSRQPLNPKDMVFIDTEISKYCSNSKID
jgi:hypothetical protein